MKSLFIILLVVFNTHIVTKAQLVNDSANVWQRISLAQNFSFTYFQDTSDIIGVFRGLKLWHNGEQIYTDTSTLYCLFDSLYPMLIETRPEEYELLLETDNRPQISHVNRIQIKKNKITRIEKLPIFECRDINLDNDKMLEFAGVLNFPDLGDDFGPYAPILYYELTSEGIFLDTKLTIEKNKFIYGNFYGYEYSEKYKFPLNSNKLFNEEVERLRGFNKVVKND